MRSNVVTTLLAQLGLSVLWLTAGCGRLPVGSAPRAEVSGSVTLDGRPLAQGIIRFVPQAGTIGPQASVEIAGGLFAADDIYGPVVGDHRVEIVSTDNGGFAIDDETAVQRLQAAGVRRIEAVRVPAAYNRHSELVASVTAEGPNDFKFDLVTPKRR